MLEGTASTWEHAAVPHQAKVRPPLTVALIVLLHLVACGSSSTSTEHATPPPDPYDPAYAARFDGTMDPRVSVSPGPEGGVVVLWPRIVTAAGVHAPEAADIQARLH